MADLTYHVPDPPARPFKKGDAVAIVDREGNDIGRQTVTAAGKRIVTTDCGRQWTQNCWRWDGEREWPFPSIRHAT